MKQVLIISYDLVKPGQNYEELLKRIKAYDGWARLGGSAYLISTERTPVEVRDHLRQVLDQNDKLFVGTSPPPSAWAGMPQDVSKWIQDNQK
jgi:hypothetical protein